MYIGEYRYDITVLTEDNRLVTVDLNCDEDWGDIRITGTEVELGNDCDGWVKLVRFWNGNGNDGTGDFLTEKFKPSVEIDRTDFIREVLVREIVYCEGLSIADHRKMLEERGFDYDSLDIPDDWKECAPDYGK